MPKRIIKKYMPSPEAIKKIKHLQFLGEKLHQPNLWHLTRHSVANAFAIGLFAAWVPFPGQMVMAALAAFYFRANLAISIALVWITNPITIPPFFYFAYRFGMFLLGRDLPPHTDFHFTVENILSSLTHIGGPLVLGSLVIATVCSAAGYFGIHAFWRYFVIKRWYRRKNKSKFT